MFNSTCSFLNELLNIDYTYFDCMVSQINPSKHTLNIANSSDTKFSFLYIHLIVSDVFD